MSDKPKLKWTRSEWLLLGIPIALVLILIYAIVSGNQTLQAITSVIAILLTLLNAVYATRELVRRTEDKVRGLLYTTTTILGSFMWLAVLIGIFFHIDPPEWAKYVIVVLLLAGAVTLLGAATWLQITQKRQTGQQKQLNQTKLEPLYGEQVKDSQPADLHSRLSRFGLVVGQAFTPAISMDNGRQGGINPASTTRAAPVGAGFIPPW